MLDASAALEVLLRTKKGDAAVAMLFARGETLHAPHLIDVEIAQVLRRYVRTSQIAAPRSVEALSDWAAFRIARYPHDWMLDRVWSLRDNLTAYDATYVALAEALGAPLVTGDARLALAPGHRANVQVL